MASNAETWHKCVWEIWIESDQKFLPIFGEVNQNIHPKMINDIIFEVDQDKWSQLVQTKSLHLDTASRIGFDTSFVYFNSDVSIAAMQISSSGYIQLKLRKKHNINFV